jgi:potassium-transporting ATPase KdpC subunit
MKAMLSEIRASVLATLALSVVCCGLYPLIVFGIGQLCFPAKANGSLMVSPHGTVLGSRLIGQSFSAEKYFHPRPSDAGNGYDATNSGGSNLGPTSQKLRDIIAQNLADYRAQNGLAADAPVPADAVTASASGLDPEISVANADLQAPRVAKARGLSLEQVRMLVRQYTEPAFLGFIGDPGVNVLRLNLALERGSAGAGGRGRVGGAKPPATPAHAHALTLHRFRTPHSAPAPSAHLHQRAAPRLEGVDNTAQGHALGITATPAQALKGRHRPHRFPVEDRGATWRLSPCLALSGLSCLLAPIPRALPWALLFPPFRRRSRALTFSSSHAPTPSHSAFRIPHSKWLPLPGKQVILNL